MHVPMAEVEPVARVLIVTREFDLLAGPLAVVDGKHKDVEVAVGARGDISELRAVRGEGGVEVNVMAGSEFAGLAGVHVEDFEVDVASVVVSGVNDPFAIGRPGRRGMILAIVGEFLGVAGGWVDAPDGALHGYGDPFAVRRPRRCPRGASRRGWDVEAVHVLGSFFGGRVLNLGEKDRGQ